MVSKIGVKTKNKFSYGHVREDPLESEVKITILEIIYLRTNISITNYFEILVMTKICTIWTLFLLLKLKTIMTQH